MINKLAGEVRGMKEEQLQRWVSSRFSNPQSLTFSSTIALNLSGKLLINVSLWFFHCVSFCETEFCWQVRIFGTMRGDHPEAVCTTEAFAGGFHICYCSLTNDQALLSSTSSNVEKDVQVISIGYCPPTTWLEYCTGQCEPTSKKRRRFCRKERSSWYGKCHRHQI